MPKGYLVAHIRVRDPEEIARFVAMSGPVIAAFGGRVLARNPAPDYKEGTLRGTTVLIEFESMEAAQRFYASDAYTGARAVREGAAETDLFLVEGL